MKSLHIPIAAKLIVITIGLLLSVATLIAVKGADKFAEKSIGREKMFRSDLSRARANEVEGLLVSYVDKAKIVASLLLKGSTNPQEVERAMDLTFRRNKDLVSVEVIPRSLPQGTSAEPLRIVNEEYLSEYKQDRHYMDRLRAIQKSRNIIHKELLFSGKDGVIEVRNSTIEGGVPLLTIGFPLAKDDFGNVTHIVLAEIRLDRLQKIFSAVSEGSLYLVDSDGRLLAHPDESKVFKNESFANVQIVKKALSSEVKQGQMRLPDESITAAYAKTALGVTVIATVSDDVILEPAREVKRLSFYLAGRILSVALFLIFLFSITLTSPIEQLADLTAKVAKGDFTVRARTGSRDEVAQLGSAFNSMIEGLLERDKMKSMFNKFHGSSVTEDLLKGDLQLGGSKKSVTVFFSDIRDFTKFSEGHTPEEVVDMLNEYFAIMVKIINANGGVVDKFIGDAIMAVWGVPTPGPQDAEHAVRACLHMRKALNDLNELRISRGQVPIKIGMGLHCGEAISGTIGSEERMEYTVIGDTVNQASRIESSTKAFGTDLLLSEDLMSKVGESFVAEEAGSVEVKGKSEPLRLFKVRGFYDDNHEPVMVRTPYSDYESGHADKVKIAG